MPVNEFQVEQDPARVARPRQRGFHRVEAPPADKAPGPRRQRIASAAERQVGEERVGILVTDGQSIDIDGQPTEVITKGRHDPCVGIRATPIAEAMLALVLMDHYLRHRAQCGDVSVSTPIIPAQAGE